MSSLCNLAPPGLDHVVVLHDSHPDKDDITRVLAFQLYELKDADRKKSEGSFLRKVNQAWRNYKKMRPAAPAPKQQQPIEDAVVA